MMIKITIVKNKKMKNDEMKKKIEMKMKKK